MARIEDIPQPTRDAVANLACQPFNTTRRSRCLIDAARFTASCAPLPGRTGRPVGIAGANKASR
jgi:hypothetical protein